jgi:ApaG protein
MFSAITDNVKVIIETAFKPDALNHPNGEFLFAYRVSIENYSDSTIQLIRRHWFITESSGLRREVEGVGVIGEQPIIEPNAFHQYISYCNIKSEIGKMSGNYTMIRLHDAYKFKILIPEFQMVVPYRLN